MKHLLSIIVSMVMMLSCYSQDSIRYRVIFIGDAGEMNAFQQKSLRHAAAHVLEGKTTVIYLGDNVYPRGMSLPGDKDQAKNEDILRSQYVPMRAKGAPVFFVPGNHDWDKSGVNGLDKIIRQGQFLAAQGDSLLKLVPANGCPDPVEIPLTDKLVIIAFDSEWWVFPFDKFNPDGDCICRSIKDVLARFGELQYRNRDKTILLASHHPFQSYGIHGGRFTWKDHLFPLTAVNKNLYIPLPVLGSLYPFLRSTFSNPEDLRHPLYRNMIKSIDGVFGAYPNLVHVAGHEHGLQFIRGRETQVISGAGAKHTNASKGKYSLFADATQGYVTADELTDNSMRFTYYIYTEDTIKQAFTYSIPYTPVTPETAWSGASLTGDSVVVQVHPSYDKHGSIHRKFFGENYRKEWAAKTTLPVIRISEINGGLHPVELGGGMQSKSLRLEDKQGKEWVIRSVEKNVEALLPDALRETFARSWLDDAISAQHPFSALIVPPIANAVKVAHASPVIGVIAPDTALGIYGRTFSNMIALVEEREPLGKSDNTAKMKAKLQEDNDNTLHGREMLRARMLDMLIGDWDRHEDQWRWRDDEKGKEKNYVAIPRDRDQVFHLNEGIIPKIVSREYVLPTLRDFDARLGHSKWLMFKTGFVNSYPGFQFSREEWMKESNKFKGEVTDSVLEAGLRRLPKASYDLRHDELLEKLRSRRERMPAALDKYYKFIQKIADVQFSDKNEVVSVEGLPNGDMRVKASKISKDGEVKGTLMDKVFEKGLTKEIRLYVRNGHDSVIVNNPSSPIRVRVIGGEDAKTYDVVAAKKKVSVYDRDNGSVYAGYSSRLRRHISNDSANTTFAAVNLNNVWQPLINVGLNLDDGFILGGGFKFTKQEGFRKFPYASVHTLMANHSFSTRAYKIQYNGEWLHVTGKMDLVVRALAKAPDNTINFFGRGNESIFSKTGDFKRFYRARFSTYQLDPAFRWRGSKGSSVSIGPSAYFYSFDKDENTGRFINNRSLIGSYDSAIVEKDKWHLGGAVEYTNDKRSSKIIPQWGSYVNIRLQAYKGINDYSRDFAQLIPQVALYKSLNPKSTIVLAERFGGTISLGKTAFYQSAFIGGQENLLGYRQYRFAGQHSFYNNLELRIKLADVASYILPGQFGITGFWDIGRVWEIHDNSGKWHNGTGAGIYFAPASMIAFSFVMGNSSEGWYPYFTLGLRF
jgi:Omp85 superfamily domain/Calcineurin-like phosphoesterase